jgi:hypothetical protein
MHGTASNLYLFKMMRILHAYKAKPKIAELLSMFAILNVLKQWA